jgi:cytochrome c biogenesis protein CcmG/thiol:disulfide interchange protein DsbE
LNRFLIPLGVFVLLAIVLAIGIKHSPEKGIIKSPLIGKPAPTFKLPLLTDSQRSMSNADLRGKWYVLNVWGTWCIECRVEHSMLLEMKRSGALTIVGMNWKDDDGKALDWLAQLGNPYDVVAVDKDGREAVNWGVYAAPETFLVNPEGVVVFKQVGGMTPAIWQNEFLSRVTPTAEPNKS